MQEHWKGSSSVRCIKRVGKEATLVEARPFLPILTSRVGALRVEAMAEG